MAIVTAVRVSGPQVRWVKVRAKVRYPVFSPWAEACVADSRQRAAEIFAELRAMGNPDNVAGMARYGIRSALVFGVSAPAIRARARALGRDHGLALALWDTGALETRILAALVDEPAAVTRGQMERWARDFDSWALCDGVCSNLFDRTRFAADKAHVWSGRHQEYVKRAGFVLMAALAVHDRRAPDSLFLGFLPVVEAQAADGRNMVKKGVNWALRQIGKRNPRLHREALAVCRRLRASDSSTARWVASDALRELTEPATVHRIMRRAEQQGRNPRRRRA
jgi:3-methyladenine DNA glycosylase AlkD